MLLNSSKSFYIFLGISIPFLTFISPPIFSISGIGPCWELLWLLPWALEEGPFSGAFGGFCLGLLLDAISLTGPTHLPPLIFLGFWWGRLGRKGLLIEKTFNLGFLAWIGAFLVGLNLWIQYLFFLKGEAPFAFNSWALHTLLAKTIMTGLLAPLVCSWLLVVFFRKKK